VKIAVALGVGFVAAPFIFIAIKGLLGLIVAAGVGITAIQFAPYFAAKVSNWRLKAIKAEAMTSPIETLQNDYNTQMGKLNSYLQSIKEFGAEVLSFESRLEGFAKTYPEEVPKFEGQLKQMKQLLEIRKQKFQEAKAGLASYEMEIKKASAIWDMSQAAIKMGQLAGLDNDEFIAKIQRETALDSVQKSLNMAFADLDIALMNESEGEKKALPPPNKNLVIDLDTPIPARQQIPTT